MKNLQQFKIEIMATIPEVRRALKLKREANKQLVAIQEMFKNSYCEHSFKYDLKNFEISKVIETACRHIVNITSNAGLKDLAHKLQYTSYYSTEQLKIYFSRLKLVKNLTLNDILDQVVDYVKTYSDYYTAKYTINNNKIKYATNRNMGGMAWSNIHSKMLDVIQLYEIAINNDIADKTILEKLHEATCANKLDQAQYKNIKIKVFQNGNYEITFADKTELEKVFKAINETVERRKNARD